MNRITVFLLLLLLSRFSCAEPWDFRNRLADAAWSWSVPQTFDLSGARLRVQHFSTLLGATAAARTLTQRSASVLSRVQIGGSELWLSGMLGSMHWLARVRSQAGKTVGEVSSLEPHHSAAFDASRFIPSGGQRVVQAAFPEQKSSSLSHWVVSGRTDEILAYVGRQLRASSWRVAGDSSGAILPPDWLRPDGARLSVVHEVRAGQVFLTFWHQKEVL